MKVPLALAALATLALPTPAHADWEIAATGLYHNQPAVEDMTYGVLVPDKLEHWGPSISGSVWKRVNVWLAIGGRVGLGLSQYARSDFGTHNSDDYTFTVVPAQLAFSAAATRGPLWVAGWLGVEVDVTHLTDNHCRNGGVCFDPHMTTGDPSSPLLGVTIGFDLWLASHTKIGPIVEAQMTRDAASIGLGFALHHR